jgi:hypothetical protein
MRDVHPSLPYDVMHTVFNVAVIMSQEKRELGNDPDISHFLVKLRATFTRLALAKMTKCSYLQCTVRHVVYLYYPHVVLPRRNTCR